MSARVKMLHFLFIPAVCLASILIWTWLGPAESGTSESPEPGPEVKAERPAQQDEPAREHRPVQRREPAGGMETAKLQAQIAALQKRLIEIQSEKDPPPVSESGGGPAIPFAGQLFSNQPRDESWAPMQESELAERLAEQFGFDKEKLDVECKTSCCSLRFRMNVPDDQWMEVQKSMFTDEVTGYFNPVRVQAMGQASMGAYYLCGDPDNRGAVRLEGNPDRRTEKMDLLKRAGAMLEVCEQAVSSPLRVFVYIQIDERGAIYNVQTKTEPPLMPEGQCVENAILMAAEFKPADRASSLEFAIDLEPR